MKIYPITRMVTQAYPSLPYKKASAVNYFIRSDNYTKVVDLGTLEEATAFKERLVDAARELLGFARGLEKEIALRQKKQADAK